MSNQAQAKRDVPSVEQLLVENQELRRRAEEAEEILRALHSGEADAILVEGDREQVYVMGTADDSYRLMIEHLPYSAVTLTPGGAVIQINTSFIEMLKTAPESVLGKPMNNFIAPESEPAMQELLRDGLQATRSARSFFSEAMEPPCPSIFA